MTDQNHDCLNRFSRLVETTNQSENQISELSRNDLIETLFYCSQNISTHQFFKNQLEKFLQSMKENDIKLEIQDAQGLNLLMHLTSKGAIDLVTFFLEKGFDLNSVDFEDKNAIFYVLDLEAGLIEQFVDLFVSYKINLIQKPSSGKSFIELLIEKNHFSIVKSIVIAIDASKKEDRNLIGTILKTKENQSRLFLKEKLGSKNFKYFDNKFLKKSRKSESSGKSETDSFLSQLKFNSNQKDLCKKETTHSMQAERSAEHLKKISCFLAENEIVLNGTKNSAVKEMSQNGWLEDKFSGVLKFEFKTIDCIKGEKETPKKSDETENKIIENTIEKKLFQQISQSEKVK